VDSADFGWLNAWKWYALKARNTYYAARGVNENGKHKTILMHRQILDAKKYDLSDHADLDGLNNQRNNLRISTPSQNGANKPARGESKYLGVFPAQGKFRAQVWKDRQKYELGYFDSEELAALAYDEKARELHGEFANLNFK
jgi:hypothetical protein